MKKGIKLFEQQKVRTHWDEKEAKWYFSVVDVISILTDQLHHQGARNYWKVLKSRLLKEGNETVTNCNRLKLVAEDGKLRFTDVADTEQLLRLIQSIPSPKAEPFKLWLAQVGSDRLNEIENPELATQRTRELYKLKGYPDDWIEKRMRSIAIREELTEEWSKNDVKLQKEYAILTAEISKATFGIAPSQHKKVKGLKNQNLRDHMNDLELIFSMLGEASTTAIVKTRKPKGFTENKKAAKQGGAVAGNARKELETKTGEKVVSGKNFLPPSKQQKQLK
jgi:DNA-damage-inducible protein D